MKKIIFNLNFIVIIVLTVLTAPISNAQIEKKELNLTPELEEMVVTEIKNLPEEDYSKYGITDRSQLMNLHFGKPIPKYRIVNEKLEDVDTWNVSRISDVEPLSLRFQNTWIVPVMSDEAPLLFRSIRFSDIGGNYIHTGTKNIMEHFHNYEHKDSIIGSVNVNTSGFEMDDLIIIRKENEDIFVQVYDEATGEYFKNEYRFSELLNHIRELRLRKKEAQMRYYEKVANKSELEFTPEITEMLVSQGYSILKNWSDETLSHVLGIKDRSQFEHLHLGKPIPMYRIVNENLTFTGCWEVPVMSNNEPFYVARIELEDDGQYRERGGGGVRAEIFNYEYKDLIVGFLGVRDWCRTTSDGYLIIRKDNQDIYVQLYDYATREYLKNAYSFSELLNHLNHLNLIEK